jgi:hypothetical protein
MMGVIVFALVVIVGVIVVIAIISGAKERAQLAAIAGQLNGITQGKQRVVGRVDDTTVSMQWVQTNNNKTTHFVVDLPAMYPLALLVRRHVRGDGGKIARGEMVDIRIGDLAFDDDFLVEAAPVDVAKLLLDGRTRAWLSALDRPELSKAADTPKLQLIVMEWISQPEDAEAHVRGLVDIATRVRDAYAKADAAVPLEQAGAPFRESFDDEARQRAARTRADEVAHVAHVQARRRFREQIIGGVIGVGVIVVYLYLNAL